jgi:2-oxoglutarate ferredoxin oxidoreductase subunit beta
VKFAKPKMKVIVVTGDGDSTAIGGNHFIHACRRNIELTIVIFSNFIYGMTGGQFSPLTPTGSLGTTAPYGNPEGNFDICELAKGAGATFIARGATYYPVELEKLISKAISHKGVAVVEAITPCPTYFGRLNKYKTPAEMMLKIEKEGTLTKAAADKLTPEQRQGKMIRGILHQVERPAYTEEYEKIITKAKGN